MPEYEDEARCVGWSYEEWKERTEVLEIRSEYHNDFCIMTIETNQTNAHNIDKQQ